MEFSMIIKSGKSATYYIQSLELGGRKFTCIPGNINFNCSSNRQEKMQRGTRQLYSFHFDRTKNNSIKLKNLNVVLHHMLRWCCPHRSMTPHHCTRNVWISNASRCSKTALTKWAKFGLPSPHASIKEEVQHGSPEVPPFPRQYHHTHSMLRPQMR